MGLIFKYLKALYESADTTGVLAEIEDVVNDINQLQLDMRNCDLMTQKGWRSFEALKNELQRVEVPIIMDE